MNGGNNVGAFLERKKIFGKKSKFNLKTRDMCRSNIV